MHRDKQANDITTGFITIANVTNNANRIIVGAMIIIRCFISLYLMPDMLFNSLEIVGSLIKLDPTHDVNIMREFIQGYCISDLSTTILVGITEKLIYPTNVKKEIVLASKVISYITLGTVIVTVSDKIRLDIGLTIYRVIFVKEHIQEMVISINMIKKLLHRTKFTENSTQTQETEMTELGSSNANPLRQSSTFSQNCNVSPYILRHQIRLRQRTSGISQYSYSLNIPQTTQTNHDIPQVTQTNHDIPQAIQTNHKMMAKSNTTNKQHVYDMKSNPCGIGIIINNKEFNMSLKSRSGTNIDAENLRSIFKYLGFVTLCHNNKTDIEMRHILNDVAAMDHAKYDCLMVAILTHGDYGDLLYGTTGQGIVIQEVIETFSGRRCQTLIGKPKLFIIQACRGRRHNQVVQLNDTNDECDMIDSGPTAHPNISDYLVAYSTIPGHVSFRNNKIGSIFISTLVEIFRRYAADEDLTTMLERVTNEVTKYKPQGGGLQDSRQSPEVRSCLRGKLYFNPG